MSYALLVSDLDGTLIDESMALDPNLVTACRRAMRRGLRITIATGRMPQTTEHYRQALDIRLPIICYNGALIRDVDAGRDLRAHRLPRGVLGRLAPIFARASVDPLFYRDEQVYCLEPTPEVRRFCDGEELEAQVLPDAEDALRTGLFVKALFIGNADALGQLRADLTDTVGRDGRLVRTAARYLEIVPAEASKGAAVRHLAQELGVALEDVVAVGDQENDVEMIRVAGLGVAMPHAPAAVRAVADAIAPRPEDGGLLALLRDVFPDHFDRLPSEEGSCRE